MYGKRNRVNIRAAEGRGLIRVGGWSTLTAVQLQMW